MSTSIDSANQVVSARTCLPASAPLIAGEDPAAYQALCARMIAVLKPNDPLEEIWVADVCDIVWDIVRLRRLKTSLMAVAAPDGMADILRGIGECLCVDLARRWSAREPTAIGDVTQRLADAGLGTDAVMAAAFAARLDAFERIDRMLASAEGRRAALLYEIEARRGAQAAARVRDAALALERPVEDAEFAVVAAPPGDSATGGSA